VEIHHDLVIDGKVVKASYNSGAKERIVHVTEIKKRPPRRAETKPISNGCPSTFFEYTFAIKGGAK
jgi:hypothetical protein